MGDGLPLVGVIGAGTMGAGIAQVAAVAGHRVLLVDAAEGASGRAIDRIRDRVKAQVAKGRLNVDPDALDLAPAATPGFIVNRIARPYYAEAWRLLEEHAAAAKVIDAVLTGAGGFRMGPFALMDLIGHDVNEAVTRSVWGSFGNDPRFAPSLAQRSLVEAGLTVFVIDDVPGLIVTRTVAMLANLASDALAGRVASAADIDTAMRLGVNYPQGPLAWVGQWGPPTVLATLDALENWYRDGHYRPSPLLRRAAATNGALS